MNVSFITFETIYSRILISGNVKLFDIVTNKVNILGKQCYWCDLSLNQWEPKII